MRLAILFLKLNFCEIFKPKIGSIILPMYRVRHNHLCLLTLALKSWHVSWQYWFQLDQNLAQHDRILLPHGLPNGS